MSGEHETNGERLVESADETPVAQSTASMQHSLQDIRKYPELLADLEGKMVRIWTGQWRAWWLPLGCGYTLNKDEAGIYDFDDAYSRTRHCDVEKQIIYEVAESASRVGARVSEQDAG